MQLKKNVEGKIETEDKKLLSNTEAFQKNKKLVDDKKHCCLIKLRKTEA